MNTSIIVQGHRGFPVCFPENSIEGVCGALAANAFAVEVDVQPALNAKPVVVHDEVLLAPDYCLPAGCHQLRVADTPVEVLETITFGYRNTPRFEHLPKHSPVCAITALDTLLSHPSLQRCRLNLELKCAHLPDVSDFVNKVGQLIEAHSKCIWRVKSFDYRAVDALVAYNDAFPVHALVPEHYRAGESLPLPRSFQLPANVQRGLCFHHSQINHDTVRELQARKLYWSVYTVNDPAVLQRVIALGAVDVITDEVASLKRQLVFHN